MLLRQSMLYMLANSASAVIGFASVMALTRLVAPADYGVFTVALGMGGVLATIFFTWQRHAIMRFQSERDADVRLSLLAGYGLTLCLHPLALAILVIAFQVPWTKAAAAVLFAAATALFELGQEVLRARQKVPAYIAGSLARSGLSFACCLAAIAYGGDGVALVLAMVAGYALAALLQSRHVWAQPRAPASLGIVKMLARYGIPITLSGLFVALTLVLDRFALFYLQGAEAAGVYGATAEFVRQCAILPAVSASLAITPLAVSSLKRDDSATTSRLLADGAELMLAVIVPAAVGLAIAAPQIAGTILGSGYREAATMLIPWFAAAYLAHMLSQQYVQLSFGLGQKPYLYIWHTSAIFLINAMLMWPLIAAFGLKGAAMSLLISEVTGVAIGIAMTRYAYPLPPIGAQLMRVLASVAFMAALTITVRNTIARDDAVGLIATVACGALSYGAAALAFNVVGARRHLSRWLAVRSAPASVPPNA